MRAAGRFERDRMNEPGDEKRSVHNLKLSGRAIYASRTDEFFLQGLMT